MLHVKKNDLDLVHWPEGWEWSQTTLGQVMLAMMGKGMVLCKLMDSEDVKEAPHWTVVCHSPEACDHACSTVDSCC